MYQLKSGWKIFWLERPKNLSREKVNKIIRFLKDFQNTSDVTKRSELDFFNNVDSNHGNLVSFPKFVNKTKSESASSPCWATTTSSST